ncbi:MAG: hypothetical protein ACF8R9_11960 [Phycisphaerales bacterium JB054]
MTTATAMAAPSEVRLPPERFYWAVLDAPAARDRRTALGYLFETVLPVPVERVHAVYLPISDGRFLACGMDREQLAAHDGALVLGPKAMPEFLDGAVDPVTINLLVESFEPRAVRRARRRVAFIACAAILACALAVGWGELRRASRWHEISESFAQATAGVYDRVLPASTGAVPPAARLTAELRTLDRTRTDAPAGSPREIAPTLAAVLASWPPGLPASTESLSAAPGAITLTVRLPDEASAERLERELKPPPGWRVSQPTVQREREGLTVRVRMEPIP